MAYYLADASTILLLSDEFWSALRRTGLPGKEHCYRDTAAFGRYIDDHAATEAAALLVIILESETSGRSSADRISNMLSRAGTNVNPAAQLSIVRCQLRAEDSAHVLAQRGLLESEHGVLLTRTHCQYPCNLGPVLTVYPDGCWYGCWQPMSKRSLLAIFVFLLCTSLSSGSD